MWPLPGSFAAVSTLLGSPLLGAFLLMEASGLGGPSLGLVLVPGLLAAGIGSLIFIGLDAWTGYGTFSLAIPGLPPSIGQRRRIRLGTGIGSCRGPVGIGIRWLALFLRPHVERRLVLLTPWRPGHRGTRHRVRPGHRKELLRRAVLGAVRPRPAHRQQRQILGGSAAVAHCLQRTRLWGVAERFPRRSHLPGPVRRRGGRNRDVSPSGLPLVDGVAMGIGAMCVVMLRLPLTSVLLATLLLLSDGLAVMPLVIVAVVVAYVVSARLTPTTPPETPRPATDAPKPLNQAAHGRTEPRQAA